MLIKDDLSLLVSLLLCHVQGFDCDLYIPNGSLFPFKCLDTDEDEIVISAKLGLHWYNFQKVSLCEFHICSSQKFSCFLLVMMDFLNTYLTSV